jgi:DNA-binding CsgD family transcriptional regulator
MLSGSALLARDEIALELAVDAAERRLGAFSPTWAIASHRLSLIHGAPSRVDPHLRDRVDNFAPTGLHLLIREAIDAGEVAVAIEAAHSQVARGPFSEALYASCQAAATGDEGRWHECLQVAATHSLRLLVVDALEGLVVVASRAESWVESLRLFGAAMRLRDECEYRWRFGSDELTLEQAVETARQHLASDEADQALLDGRALPWAEAVAYARRSRGERKRPSHGWDSLTPTEWQVVDLVSEGLTNPQIGIRLLMGRATVKTHLEHIFNKIGVRSRSELASAAARRDPKVPAYVRSPERRADLIPLVDRFDDKRRPG